MQQTSPTFDNSPAYDEDERLVMKSTCESLRTDRVTCDNAVYNGYLATAKFRFAFDKS
jgi:hypothetical protein